MTTNQLIKTCKEKILKGDKAILFKYDGLIMIVNVVEKVSEKEMINNKYCDIVAKTDAKIKSMNVHSNVKKNERRLVERLTVF